MKRNLLKKISALAISTALLFGGAISVSAAPLPPATGDLTVHKYVMPDTSQAEDPNNGYEAGTNGNPAVPSTATPLDNIKFDMWLVKKNANGDYPGAAPYRLNAAGTQITDAAGDVFDLDLTTHQVLTTSATGEATATGLPQGVYFLTEQADSRVTSPCDPFVVAVPMTNPAGDGWIDHVHVYPKNENAAATKEIISGGTSITIGDTVGYRIKPTVPSGIWTDIAAEDSVIQYVVNDELDEALDFQASTLVVKGVKSDGTEITLTPVTDYVVGKIGAAPGKDFNITFTATGRAKLSKDAKTSDGALANGEDVKSLIITFDTKVNEKVLTKPHREVDNTATIDFTNKWGDTSTTTTNTVTTHTGIIELLKYDATQGTTAPLADAEFHIALTESDAKAGNYLKKDADGNIVRPTDAGYATALEWMEKSDSNGHVYFKGLQDYATTFDADGNETGRTYNSYWIVETKAPDGYNLLDAPREITFTAADHGKDPADEENSYKVIDFKVENTNEFQLPKTGGMGTILFTVVGIILIGSAVLLMVSGRRKKTNK